MKKLKAIKNDAGGYDLLTERSAGNEIRILTGREELSRQYWERLQTLCKEVLWELYHAVPEQQAKEL